jgi:hypothetical protein
MKAWKMAEKEVAEYFGGMRRSRGADFGQSIGDIIHPHYSIEVKWGKQVPNYCRVKEATIICLTRKVKFLLCPHRDVTIIDKKIVGYFHYLYPRKVFRKNADFLMNAFEQARRYAPDKQPLVCLKPKSRRGFIICDRYE